MSRKTPYRSCNWQISLFCFVNVEGGTSCASAVLMVVGGDVPPNQRRYVPFPKPVSIPGFN